jgi:hypothetical protein
MGNSVSTHGATLWWGGVGVYRGVRVRKCATLSSLVFLAAQAGDTSVAVSAPST